MANHRKQRNKKKPEEIARINARFEAKYEEFVKLDLDTLKKMFNETKMSGTDKDALIEATQVLMKSAAEETLKSMRKDGEKEIKQVSGDKPKLLPDVDKDNK